MNTFGDAQQQFVLCDPRGVREARIRFRRPPIPLLDCANSMYAPTGRWPTKGWILLPRRDYDKLDKYGANLHLNIGDTKSVDNVGTLKNLAIVQAQCVTRGLAADLDALYLVELTDARGILHNEWFQFPLTARYNIRAPAYPQTFHPESLNSGTTWTWATMLEDIWERMGAHLGPWPGLPSGVNPAGTPEGFWFIGVPAWKALCDVLDHLGLTVACDLTNAAAPYTIVQPGAADAVFTALQAKYKTHLEDDLEWIDAGAGRVPATVTVLFRRRNAVYGTEETVYYGVDEVAKQWNMDMVHSVSIAAPTAFSSAIGEHYLWSDFTVRYDDSSNPLDEDVATALAIARERVTNYFSRIDPGGYMTQTYAGALPFKTGSLVDGVCWYQHYLGDKWAGWRTRIVGGMSPPFADVYG